MKFPKEIKFYNFPQKVFFGLFETTSPLLKTKEQRLRDKGLTR